MQAKTAFVALALAASAAAHGNNLLDSLKSQAGNYAMPAIGQSTIGNAAGVLQYCVKNNYLGGDAASVKDKLLAKITGQKPQETGFASGAKGLLKGGDGQTLNFKILSSKVKTKACDYVLKNATSLI